MGVQKQDSHLADGDGLNGLKSNLVLGPTASTSVRSRLTASFPHWSSQEDPATLPTLRNPGNLFTLATKERGKGQRQAQMSRSGR